MITGHNRICMVIGDPIEHSMSPILHNIGYAARGLQNQFVYVAAKVAPKDLAEAVKGIRAMGVRGVSVTSPHKEKIIPLLDEIDDTAKKIGAVNTILVKGKKLIGYNTDYLGVLTPLSKATKLVDKKAAVIGSGGAAKGIAYALARAGANVTIYNRTLSKAKQLARAFGCQYAPITDIEGLKSSDIICNATMIGMTPHENESLVPAECFRKGQVVMDIVYSPRITKLLREAADRGATTIEGIEMLLYQAIGQFELFTGQTAPVGTMRQALHTELGSLDTYVPMPDDDAGDLSFETLGLPKMPKLLKSQY